MIYTNITSEYLSCSHMYVQGQWGPLTIILSRELDYESLIIMNDRKSICRFLLINIFVSYYPPSPPNSRPKPKQLVL